MRPVRSGAVWLAIIVVLLVSATVAAWPHDDSPRTSEARIERLASQIRCPTCAGLSVADSDAPLAQSSRSEIARRVAAGESDALIRVYFVSRYGETVLIDPPKEGATAVAWTLPIVFAAGAIAVIVSAVTRWRRSTSVSGTSDDEHFALRDEQAPSAVETARGVQSADSSRASGAVESRSIADREFDRTTIRTRNIVRMVVIAFIVVAATGVLIGTVERLGGDELTGTSSEDVNTLLRNAQQLTASGEGLDAVKTYDKVLERDPDNVEALTYRGWLVRLAGLPDEGLRSIDRAIALRPEYPDARFFKGFILMRDRDDPDAAIGEFRAFLANDPPREMISLVEQALKEAEALAAAR